MAEEKYENWGEDYGSWSNTPLKQVSISSPDNPFGSATTTFQLGNPKVTPDLPSTDWTSGNTAQKVYTGEESWKNQFTPAGIANMEDYMNTTKAMQSLSNMPPNNYTDSYISDSGYRVFTKGNKIVGQEWVGVPQSRTTSSADASWGRKGYPAETSASLIGSGSGLSRYGGGGRYAIGGGFGLGRTSNPMPYFSGLKDQYGMEISSYDPKYWKMPDKPTLNVPTYTPTARNEGRISELSQKAGAVGMGKLGRALTTALSQARGVGDNPMAEQTTRSALRGYGEGLDSVMGQAQQMGLQQYEKEYQPLEEANRMNYEGKMKQSLADYQTENQRINAMYEAALREYFGR